MTKQLGAAVVVTSLLEIFIKKAFSSRAFVINVKKENSPVVVNCVALILRVLVIEKFYIRDNITHQWTTNSRGELIQFSSQRMAKRHANKCLHRFTIISFNTKTKKIKWRGGDHV